MTKKRPVIIVSPRLPHRSKVAAIVPISTTAPKHDLPFVVRLSKNYHPSEDEKDPCWAKCDMLLNISTERLQSFKVGRRKYHTPTLNDEDFKAVQQGVIHGLGLMHLLKV